MELVLVSLSSTNWCYVPVPLLLGHLLPGNNQPVHLAGGWLLALICSERKVMFVGGWWLVCSERKILLVGCRWARWIGCTCISWSTILYRVITPTDNNGISWCYFLVLNDEFSVLLVLNAFSNIQAILVGHGGGGGSRLVLTRSWLSNSVNIHLKVQTVKHQF
jgi:hypothetical protein